MRDRISQALAKLFERHRIVFWIDEKRELRLAFETADLPGVEKIALANNEFGVKHRILREQPDQKFLVYRDGPPPVDPDNWLLDVQLSCGQFQADQASLWLVELGLGVEFAEVVRDHREFFRSDKRIEALKNLLGKEDTRTDIRKKMLAVCAGTNEPDHVLEQLLNELAAGQDQKCQLIMRCGLGDFLWDQLRRNYGYESPSPGVRDFSIALFKSCYAMGTGEKVNLNGSAVAFLRRWKDSTKFGPAFQALARQYGVDLKIMEDLNTRDYRDVVAVDYFREIDQKIVADLLQAVEQSTVSVADCELIVEQRRQSCWFGEFSHLYEASIAASQFCQLLETAQLVMESAADAINRYAQTWFRLDQLYRGFVFHVRSSGEATLLDKLTEKVENLYSNRYLLTLNNRWQQFVDEAAQWPVAGAVPQARFFETWVRPFLKKGQKVFVIISDALRFEIGEELMRMVRQEDRYEAELQTSLTLLPSNTQLGMAALLPNQGLEMSGAGNSVVVRIGGQNTQGVENRSKILNAEEGWTGKAITAEEFLDMPREGDAGYRKLFSGNDVVYIYHNRIDAVGDKRDSEERVFEAVQVALDELVKMVRKLSTANATNMIVTADHGFIYQNRPIDEADFLQAEPAGMEIVARSRRFVLGRGLEAHPSFKKYSPAQMGLSGDMEILIPNSIARLRLQGSGSRYVHGGASIQEVVAPVVLINKKRQSDLCQVEVNILPAGSMTITSGQVVVGLYQEEAATEKVQPRTIRAGFYTGTGTLISDLKEFAFDRTSLDPREREFKAQFVLTHEADQANGQQVFLKLMEPIAQTSHYREYKSLPYMLRRSFTQDFDL